MEVWLGIAKFVFDIVGGLFAVAAFVYSYVAQRQRASKQALVDLEAKLESRLKSYQDTGAENHSSMTDSLRALEVRMERLDVAVKHLPTTSDITNLAQSVSLLATSVAELKGEVSGTTRTVERMNQYLMERGQ